MSRIRHRASARSVFFFALLGLGLELGLSSESSHAGQYWFEFGGGVAQLEKSSQFFGNGAPDSIGLGGSFILGAGLRISTGNVPLHFGVQHRVLLTSAGSTAYGLQATYPVLRADLDGVYFSAGFTPFIWRRSSATAALDSYQWVNPGTSFLGEVGLQLPITPQVSFNLAAAAQFVQSSSGTGPAPTVEGTASFRFFYGKGGNSRTRTRSDAKGWRYPFGIELRK